MVLAWSKGLMYAISVDLVYLETEIEQGIDFLSDHS